MTVKYVVEIGDVAAYALVKFMCDVFGKKAPPIHKVCNLRKVVNDNGPEAN